MDQGRRGVEWVHHDISQGLSHRKLLFKINLVARKIEVVLLDNSTGNLLDAAISGLLKVFEEEDEKKVK